MDEGREQGFQAEETAKRLQSRLDLEEILLSVSATLVGAKAAEVDAAATAALRRIAEFLETSIAFTFLYNEERTHFTCAHEHNAPGVQSGKASFVNVPVASLPWFTSLLMAGRPVVVPEQEALPTTAFAERGFLAATGITSVLMVPMQTRAEVIGGIGFLWRGRQGAWPEETLTLLRLSGELLAGLLVRQRTENSLRRVEERLRSFLASTVDAVLCFEIPEGLALDAPVELQFATLWSRARVVETNTAYLQMAGLTAHTAAPLLDLPIEQVVGLSTEVARPLYQQLADSKYALDGLEVQSRLGGVLRDLRVSVRSVMRAGRIERLWCIVRDVTEEKQAAAKRAQLEGQLRKMQKIESIGLLAGGIAHDFNNLLFVIGNCAALARADLTRAPAEAEESLIQIEAAYLQAADLTKRLLAFTRQRDLDLQPTDLNEVLTGLIPLVRRLIPETIEIDFSAGKNLGAVSADAAQIGQVFLNLCVNASDAILEVGRISLATETVEVPAALLVAHSWAKPGRFALLTLSDTGVGMTESVREHIFEPFFTTKEQGRGTGLGLAVVYGIVRQHGGFVEVASEVGRGSTFKVYLPFVGREAPRTSQRTEARAPGGQETILVAEDHALVREVVVRLLEGVGYRVLVAKNGAEALALYEEQGSAIDLLLLDAVMPQVSGRAVFEHITSRRPELPILIASGYTRESFPPLEGGRHAFIHKPYEADRLLRTIRELLEARRDKGS